MHYTLRHTLSSLFQGQYMKRKEGLRNSQGSVGGGTRLSRQDSKYLAWFKDLDGLIIIIHKGKRRTGQGMNSASKLASMNLEWMASMLITTSSVPSSSATSPITAVAFFPSPSLSNSLNSSKPPEPTTTIPITSSHYSFFFFFFPFL